jgi:hypothetical protein
MTAMPAILSMISLVSFTEGNGLDNDVSREGHRG